jgi:hypothetical protein
MSMTDPYSDLGVADRDGRTTNEAESPAHAADRRVITGAAASEVLVAGELLANDAFIVRVLRRAHQAVQPVRWPGEHRVIRRVAHLFADDLERTDPGFDRVRFIEAAAQGHRHARVAGMHKIGVSVVSAEEASFGVAEFWSDGRMIGFTQLDDADLMLRVEPRDDGAAVVVGVHGLVDALAEVNRLLAAY